MSDAGCKKGKVTSPAGVTEMLFIEGLVVLPLFSVAITESAKVVRSVRPVMPHYLVDLKPE